MRFHSFRSFFAATGLTLMVAMSAEAATVKFFQGSSPGTFITVGETRDTLFQTLTAVTLTALGAEIDPVSSSSLFTWQIFNANASNPSGSGPFGSKVFDSGAISFLDGGLATYDLNVNVSLASSCVLCLAAGDAFGTGMRRYDESGDPPAPFITTDGKFSVLDGGAGPNGIIPPGVFSSIRASNLPLASRRPQSQPSPSPPRCCSSALALRRRAWAAQPAAKPADVTRRGARPPRHDGGRTIARAAGQEQSRPCAASKLIWNDRVNDSSWVRLPHWVA